MPSIEEVLTALTRLDCEPKKRGAGQWKSRCPLYDRHAHNDATPSLSVAIGRDNVIGLVHCHAGCDGADVLTVLRGEVDQLEDLPPLKREPPEPPEALPSDKELIVARAALTWDVSGAVEQLRGWSYDTLQAFQVGYHDRHLVLPFYERGKLVNVGKYRPGQGKVIGLRGRRKPLYHVPILETDAPLWIVEGEPDALSAYELGLMAVGVPGVNNWRQEYAQRFTGRHVRVCMDCDRPGREAAYRIFADLVPFASGLKVVDLEPLRDDGYDMTDFLMDAHAKDELPEARAYLKWLETH